MQDLSSDDTRHIVEPPQGSDIQGSTSRTRKKRGIVSNDDSTFWDKGIVPYVYDDNLGKLFMFVHVCVDCSFFFFFFKYLWDCLSLPLRLFSYLPVCLNSFFSLFLSLSLVLLCVPYINNSTYTPTQTPTHPRTLLHPPIHTHPHLSSSHPPT